MATFTIKVSCPVDPFPYEFCLIYGSADCQELGASFSSVECN